MLMIKFVLINLFLWIKIYSFGNKKQDHLEYKNSRVNIFLKIFKNVVEEYKNGAITSDSKICSEIGSTVLKKGGNAIDAAIAAEFCLSVIDMQATGIGGGGKMLIYIKSDSKVNVLNFRERSPLNVDKIPKNARLRLGPYSIAVPGSVHGLFRAWKKYGSLEWADLVEPSIRLASKGFKMTSHLRRCTKNVVHHIPPNSLLRNILLSGGRVKKIGSTVKNLDLANTLLQISKDPMIFYNGSLATKMIEDIKEAGGILTSEDFSRYESKWEEPLKFSVNRGVIGYSPSEKSGGPLIAFILRLLKEIYRNRDKPINKDDLNLFYHRMVEVFKFAHALRSEILNSIHTPFKLSFIRYLSHKINDNQTSDPSYYMKEKLPSQIFGHGTSHLSVFDAFGNAVALTSSINTQLGSYIMSSSTGVLFNNHMADFNLRDNKKYKLLEIADNEIEPNSEPFSSMCPIVIIDKTGNVKMVSGASGGPLIPTTISQILINRFWLKMGYDESIRQGRIHHQLIPNKIQYEAHLPPPHYLEEYLKSKGHLSSRIYRCRRSASNSIFVGYKDKRYSNDRSIVAVADGRKRGGVAGY
ncbi:hypothetical protein HZS_2285 [Henneguya salminicola]|nr:hypothetical protein HZS_2285 [Henneguya salminicola]